MGVRKLLFRVKSSSNGSHSTIWGEAVKICQSTISETLTYQALPLIFYFMFAATGHTYVSRLKDKVNMLRNRGIPDITRKTKRVYCV